MMALTHVMVGVSAYCLTATAGGHLPLTAMTVAAAAVGSLLPDLDHPSSWIGKRLLFVSIPLATLLGHRGLTHSLLAALAATACLAWDAQEGHVPWLAAFFVGYLSHLVADWNTGGLPLLWPSSRRFCAPWAFPTGGIFERLLAIGLGYAMLYLGTHSLVAIGRFLQ